MLCSTIISIGGLPLAALVTCLALLAALFCSLKLIEPARGGSSLNLRRSSSAISAQSRTGMTGVAYAGWRHIVHTTKDFRHDKRLMVVLLFSSLTFAFSETVHNLKGVFLLDRGVRLASQGWWTAISFALSSAGSLYANELSNRLGDIGTLALCNVMSGLSMLAATYAPPQYSALLLMSGSFMWGVQWPVSSHLLNSCTLSHRRATIISVVSLVKKLGLAMCAPGLSLIVDTFCDKSNTILLAFQAASVLLMFIPVVLLLYPEEQSATALAQSFEDLMDDLHNSNPSISGETTMATVLSENILSDERLLSPNDGNETKKTR
ncbi:hypothetical protein SARC_02776 [Sphaeroforma arctica JP610]|uniref:Major facilitator superfamily (MFS) profile domain-containing protein n=1 Tax=Sphaeroforma arctica JP610 TaxID=667725 RepID=A0A0L0G804_9EUKA|nr:hypothetical protein SARC_02776 [Sphaeroforma arctica JP610]KNC85021.1 hypothetical protein SARC_02776 [Sphaeroforma arctica JP610]|eukprot:XP_014158923.1 hypothetical protein SARC_02776 [Sphaeroforma arctica JP610]